VLENRFPVLVSLYLFQHFVGRGLQRQSIFVLNGYTESSFEFVPHLGFVNGQWHLPFFDSLIASGGWKHHCPRSKAGAKTDSLKDCLNGEFEPRFQVK